VIWRELSGFQVVHSINQIHWWIHFYA